MEFTGPAQTPPLGLRCVEITTQPDNAAWQKVIRGNGGVVVEAFTTVAALGGAPELRFRIAVTAAAPEA